MVFKIEEKLANEILNYLAERPMREVENMVNGLRRLEMIELTEEVEKAEEKIIKE